MNSKRNFKGSLYQLIKVSLFLIFAHSPNVLADNLLNGVATHAELGKEQFIAGLYTTTPTNSSVSLLTSNEPKKLQVRVLTEQLSSRRFKRMWIEGMAINSSPAELERHAKNMANFSNMVKIKMIAGDVFTVARSLDSVDVFVNDTLLGQIEDTSFFDLLLRTWIGPVPLSSDFRKDLLAQGEIEPQSLTRFQSTSPSQARVALIASAIAAKRAKAAELAAAAVAPSIKAPAVAKPKPSPKPKKTVAAAPPKPTPTKAPVKVVAAKPSPSPSPKPKQIALAPMEEELDESIFDDGDDIEFTAESLLKEQLYYSRLAKYTHRFLSYPQKAWDKGREGNIRMRVTIDRTGNVKDSEILEKSEFKSLNKEAKKAVSRATPYPAMPDDIQGDEYSFTFRIAFKIIEGY